MELVSTTCSTVFHRKDCYSTYLHVSALCLLVCVVLSLIEMLAIYIGCTKQSMYTYYCYTYILVTVLLKHQCQNYAALFQAKA